MGSSCRSYWQQTLQVCGAVVQARVPGVAHCCSLEGAQEFAVTLSMHLNVNCNLGNPG